MAKRPINHIIGDSAVRKISADLIPEEWTISIPDSDYGLDMLIEVVQDNKTTGKQFYIQSKGTTESSHDGAITYSMNVERVKDYGEIKIPVMFVYYSKTEKLFWGRWMNSLYNTLTEEQKQQETISLRFSAANVIDVDYLRGIADAIVPSITKAVSLIAATGMSEQFTRFHSQVVATAQRLIGSDIISDPHLSCYSITLSYQGNLQDGAVEIRSDSYLASIPINLLSTEILYYPPLARDECPPCVLEIIYTIALFSSGISSQSLDYALALPQRETLDYIPDCVWIDLLDRVCGEYLQKVQGLFYLVVQANRENLAQFILLIVVAQITKSHENEVLYHRLLSYYLEAVQDDSSKGRLCYNMANSMRQIDCREAFGLYIKAVHFEPFYRELFYWWEEVGGVLYLTGHHYFAENFYKQARRLSPSMCREDIGILIADCQVCQGKINEAMSEESAFLGAHKNISSSNLLKSFVTEMMDQEGIQVFDPVYWFNQGVSYSREGNHKESMDSFLIAWRLFDGDLEALTNAFIEAFNCWDEIKMPLILSVIRDQAPEKGYKMLVSILVSNNNGGADVGVFLDSLKELFFQKDMISTEN